MQQNEKLFLEPLGKTTKIFTDDIHKFTTDSILLADFSSRKKVNTALELCCGSGAITLIWCRNNICKQIYSVDIQKKACNLLQRSIEFNGLSDIVHIINDDLNNLTEHFRTKRFDMITVNPPYQIIGNGKQNENDEKTIARHENCCTIENIIYISSKLLNFSGSLYLCCRPQRLSEIIVCMKKHNIEPKELQLVQQSATKPPKLFLLRGCLGGKQYMNILPTLFINDELGNYSDAMKKIYGEYLNESGRIN